MSAAPTSTSIAAPRRALANMVAKGASIAVENLGMLDEVKRSIARLGEQRRKPERAR